MTPQIKATGGLLACCARFARIRIGNPQDAVHIRRAFLSQLALIAVVARQVVSIPKDIYIIDVRTLWLTEERQRRDIVRRSGSIGVMALLGAIVIA